MNIELRADLLLLVRGTIGKSIQCLDKYNISRAYISFELDIISCHKIGFNLSPFKPYWQAISWYRSKSNQLPKLLLEHMYICTKTRCIVPFVFTEAAMQAHCYCRKRMLGSRHVSLIDSSISRHRQFKELLHIHFLRSVLYCTALTSIIENSKSEISNEIQIIVNYLKVYNLFSQLINTIIILNDAVTSYQCCCILRLPPSIYKHTHTCPKLGRMWVRREGEVCTHGYTQRIQKAIKPLHRFFPPSHTHTLADDVAVYGLSS